ncbi:uncharacterized protein LOC136028940 [Artemia franciscana]|uniref:G-protein coupled receptors family 1 profile domain-containing protein n=1 Tax=Artemia franciscana TaxID=6661 RepID=A0AA88KYJ1_ARTSF|nr:hypothetical protein QYM36_014747 [Artemia franciscana]
MPYPLTFATFESVSEFFASFIILFCLVQSSVNKELINNSTDDLIIVFERDSTFLSNNTIKEVIISTTPLTEVTLIKPNLTVKLEAGHEASNIEGARINNPSSSKKYNRNGIYNTDTTGLIARFGKTSAFKDHQLQDKGDSDLQNDNMYVNINTDVSTPDAVVINSTDLVNDLNLNPDDSPIVSLVTLEKIQSNNTDTMYILDPPTEISGIDNKHNEDSLFKTPLLNTSVDLSASSNAMFDPDMISMFRSNGPQFKNDNFSINFNERKLKTTKEAEISSKFNEDSTTKELLLNNSSHLSTIPNTMLGLDKDSTLQSSSTNTDTTALISLFGKGTAFKDHQLRDKGDSDQQNNTIDTNINEDVAPSYVMETNSTDFVNNLDLNPDDNCISSIFTQEIQSNNTNTMSILDPHSEISGSNSKYNEDSMFEAPFLNTSLHFSTSLDTMFDSNMTSMFRSNGPQFKNDSFSVDFNEENTHKAEISSKFTEDSTTKEPLLNNSSYLSTIPNTMLEPDKYSTFQSGGPQLMNDRSNIELNETVFESTPKAGTVIKYSEDSTLEPPLLNTSLYSSTVLKTMHDNDKRFTLQQDGFRLINESFGMELTEPSFKDIIYVTKTGLGGINSKSENDSRISTIWSGTIQAAEIEPEEDGSLYNGRLIDRANRTLTTFAGSICVIIIFLSIFGNILTLYAILQTPKLQKVASFFISSLCVSDMLYSTLAMPFFTTRFLSSGSEDMTARGPLCILVPFIQYYCLGVSLLSISFISVNRFIIVAFFRWYAQIYTRKNGVIMILCIWFTSFCFCLPTLVGKWGRFGLDSNMHYCSIVPDENNRSSKAALITAGFLVPCITIVVSYGGIFLVVHRSENRMRSHRKSAPALIPDSGEHHLGLSQAELKVTKMVLAVFLSFLACYLPNNIVKVIDEKAEFANLHVISSVLLYCSCCINPFIYPCINQDYRRSYSKMLGSATCFKGRKRNLPASNTRNGMTTTRNGFFTSVC